MSWTQADIDALKLALKRGVRRVAYADRVVEYVSMNEMMTLLGLMEAEVAEIEDPYASGGRRTLATFSRE